MPRPGADEDVFRAVADPTRHAVLEALTPGGSPAHRRLTWEA
jgi:hypothetical protein